MPSLQKNLGFAQGLALYLAAVLGIGILIIPLLAWKEGGAASLVAWAILGVVGLALAWSFAAAGSQMPNAGGVQAMIGRVFGQSLETVTKYLIFFSVPAGAVPASYIFSYHLCAAFHLPVAFQDLLAYASWIIVGIGNYRGIRISATMQLLLSGLLVAMLSVFLVVSVPHLRFDQFTPFAPFGMKGIGKAAVLIFWSFLGWEAIAHLAEEFRNPKRDMLRASLIAAVIIAFFYFAISFVLIGMGVFQMKLGQFAPFVNIAEQFFGRPGAIFTGVLAAVICLGTMNVYMAALSRLGYSMGRSGELPAFLARLDFETGTPRNSVLVQLLINMCALSIQALFHLPLRTFFLIQNLAFLVLYIFGCLAAARLLRGNRAAVGVAYFAALACALMLPFADGLLLYPAVITVFSSMIIVLKRRMILTRAKT